MTLQTKLLVGTLSLLPGLGMAQDRSPMCSTATVPDTSILGHYTADAGVTSAQFQGMPGSQQGGSGVPMQIVRGAAGLELVGWPMPGNRAPLRVAVSMEGDWDWTDTPDGPVSRENAELLAGCPIRFLPRFEAVTTTRDATGIEITHRLRLVLIYHNSLSGEWVFEAQGANMGGAMSVALTSP